MEIVPFEIAKKLKEKGFRENCLTYYDVEDNVGLLYNTQYTDYMLPCHYTDLLQSHNTDATVAQPDDSDNCADAPTISQVLKWLREKYATHIEIALGRNGWYFEIVQYEYYEEENEYSCKLITISVIYDSYELAALAGIEYVIDNLI